MATFAEKKLPSDLEMRLLKKGDLLIKQGERATEMFLIKAGG